MQPPQLHSRINLAELKAQLVSKLGSEGSKKYFYYLNRLLSLKLNKFEFDKLCLRIIGRESIVLHNQFIRSILKNSCCATVPPAKYDDRSLKSMRVVLHRRPSSNECQKNESHHAFCQAQNPPVLSSRDILPVSPRKSRTGPQERRGGDRHRALGSSVKTNIALYENEVSSPSDIQHGVHHHQGLMQITDHVKEDLGHFAPQLLENKKSLDGPVSVHSSDKIELLVREDGKQLTARSLLCAPLGVPFCHASVGGAHRGVPLPRSSKCASSLDSDGLLDTTSLRERMMQIAATHALEGVSLHCANVLNSALDSYLKGLIRSCLELVGAKSVHDPLNISTHKNQAHRQLVNGLRTDYDYQMQSANRSLEAMQENTFRSPISLLDFRVSMELNHRQLGEEWPLLLEKLCTRAFEE